MNIPVFPRFRLLLSVALALSSSLSSCQTRSSDSTVIPLSQANLQNTQLIEFNDQGQQFTFQIRDAELDPKDTQQELYLYTVFYQDVNHNWQNLCHGGTHYEAKAIALQGSWDSAGNYHAGKNLVTFSCVNSALAKCDRFGYKPWEMVKGQSLKDYHQTCVRMVRADYCGDGTSHTKDNTPINIYDRLGIQKPDEASEMRFEASWGTDGAQTIHHTRYPEDLAYVQRVCPERLAAEVKGSKPLPTAQQDDSKALLFNDSSIRTP